MSGCLVFSNILPLRTSGNLFYLRILLTLGLKFEKFLNLNIKKNCIQLFILVGLGLFCYVGFSLVATSQGYSLVVVHRLLIAMGPLASGHRLSSAWASVVVAPGFWSTGSIVASTRAQLLCHLGGPPRIRERTCVSCIGRWILYY